MDFEFGLLAPSQAPMTISDHKGPEREYEKFREIEVLRTMGFVVASGQQHGF